MNKNLDLIYSLAYEKLKSQFDNSRSIDTKSAIILAVYGVIINSLASKMPSNFSFELLLLSFITCFVLIFVGIFLCIRSLTTRKFKYPPNLPNLKRKYLETNETETKRKLLASLINAHGINVKTISKKLRWLNLSIRVFLPISIIMSLVTIIVNSLGG